MGDPSAQSHATRPEPRAGGVSGEVPAPNADWGSDDALRWLYQPVDRQRLHLRARHSRDGRPLRGLIALMLMLPLLVLLSIRFVRIVDDAFLTLYGFGVLAATILVMYISFGWYHDKSRGIRLPANPPLVSCMLAVRDDIDVIARCVGSVLDSTYPALELIVVDDDSTDGTRELLQELALRRPFTLVCLDRNVGKKRALTVAASRAKGDVFVFTDSDCIVSPHAITQCVKALTADPDVGAVSGHARALNGERNLLTRMQDTWYDGQFAVAKAAESVLGTVTCVSGPMAAFRRSAIYDYLPAWAEDTFLGREFKFATDRQLTAYVLGQDRVGAKLKARHANSDLIMPEGHPPRRWRVEYVSSARVLTNVPETPRTMLKQQARWKKSFIRNLFFTGGFLWRRGVLPSFLFYGHVLWVCAAPVLAFRHLVWLPAHGEVRYTFVYLAGVLLKGSVWALAYKAQNPRSWKWVYRPLMSLMSSVCLSWILPYSALTLRRGVWSRG